MKTKLRYKIILQLNKIFTPKIYNFLKCSQENGNIYLKELVELENKDLGKIPRPAIEFALQTKKDFQNIIEIGVNKGNNAESIYNLLNPRYLFLVDIWENKKIYNQVKYKFIEYNNIELIKKTSINASNDFPDDFFDLIYIDALHDYNNVMNDLISWYPKLKINGIFSGHDIHNIFVKQAILDFCYDNNISNLIINHPNDWYFIKI